MSGIPSRIDAATEFAIAGRRQIVEDSDLPRSSTLPYSLPLAFNDVDVHSFITITAIVTPDADGMTRQEVRKRIIASEPSPTLTDTLTATVCGPYDLWFDHDARGMISFADEADAVLFACGRKSVVS